ncbi:hypothetical protein PHYBLDRAFT_67739 [Phycomyces blakesleeanus NRRL 1555(-)]|uniref:Uncharacterized protein n=1 Tax=Phycomyces blakesleeanus (strain ATCC 8743b / DSM 1359 / FGSC 10004 / NBRC 33097 / NRRL 1555) TaxID=763407 RepID=A0A162UGA9_PHYB8|nr:hypothetical protein PHYBLDRAFT_67739 [Phycomyces blakesleeanus NRRL 1555(-)]OAD74973.1 hypothetical protein PHYBLDRAFT_67739 [Phycomyces blakesleeanus NRRL 1555(-)]|eukprot:XP_018293013.1 hypothetical protein PHYBLDRAFT_67739 [Phycomyces blakesleeanus NRRL 1555(-)]
MSQILRNTQLFEPVSSIIPANILTANLVETTRDDDELMEDVNIEQNFLNMNIRDNNEFDQRIGGLYLVHSLSSLTAKLIVLFSLKNTIITCRTFLTGINLNA